MSKETNDKSNLDIEYRVEIPLFAEEASELWKDMPNIIKGIVTKKQEAIDSFNKLDSLVNGGVLQPIGKAFGEIIYARIKTNDQDYAKYMSERLAKMMGSFIASEPEEITLGDKRYTVILKEKL